MCLRYDGSEHGPSLIAQISKLADMLANAYELALRSPAAKEPGASSSSSLSSSSSSAAPAYMIIKRIRSCS